MGFPGLHIDLSQAEVLDVTTDKRNPLGARGMASDGRVYKYSFSGEALSVGIPLNTLARGGLATAGQTVLVNDTEDLTSTSSQIVLSSTNSTWGAIKDEYADGYFIVEASTHTNAAGQMVRVKSNTAGSTSTTDSPYETTITFATESRLIKGLDTGPTLQVIHNEYFDVLEHDGGSTNLPVIGVPNMDVADNRYFWAQTWGPCVVLQSGAWVLGDNVISSTASDQGLQAIGIKDATSDTFLDGSTGLATFCFGTTLDVTRPAIGWVLGPDSGDNDYGLLFLTISP